MQRTGKFQSMPTRVSSIQDDRLIADKHVVEASGTILERTLLILEPTNNEYQYQHQYQSTTLCMLAPTVYLLQPPAPHLTQHQLQDYQKNNTFIRTEYRTLPQKLAPQNLAIPTATACVSLCEILTSTPFTPALSAATFASPVNCTPSR